SLTCPRAWTAGRAFCPSPGAPRSTRSCACAPARSRGCGPSASRLASAELDLRDQRVAVAGVAQERLEPLLAQRVDAAVDAARGGAGRDVVIRPARREELEHRERAAGLDQRPQHAPRRRLAPKVDAALADADLAVVVAQDQLLGAAGK